MTDTEEPVGVPDEPAAEAPLPDAPVTDEPAPEAAAEDPLAAERARARRPWVVAAAILLIAATFLGVLASRYHSQLTAERDERRAAEEVAARFATAFVTYDYRNLDASLARIKGDATTKFANQYQKLFQTGVKTLITETQAQSKGTVTDVFLQDVGDDAATALTVVNVARQGKGGRIPVAGTYLELDLVKQSGRWKVDNVTAINFTQSTAGPAAPNATTTTTVAK